MKTTADRKEKFWHVAAEKLCELRGVDPNQRIRVKNDTGHAVAVSATARAAAIQELRNLHIIADALEYADSKECLYCRELDGHSGDCNRPTFEDESP